MSKLKFYSLHLMKKYRNTYNQRMDEMKLHKLLYYSQKESFASRNKELFEEDFHG